MSKTISSFCFGFWILTLICHLDFDIWISIMHIPVLQQEVIKYLAPKPNESFIDATIGEGGHTALILKENQPDGRVLGIEEDTELCQKMKERMREFSIFNQFSKRLTLVNDSYINLKEIVGQHKFRPVNGILFDFGMSSWHLENSGRGFSFQKDEPLDMRYNSLLLHSSREKWTNENKLTAEIIVNEWQEKDIEKILREYGEERFSRKIAREIIQERKIKRIKTTFQLVNIIEKAVYGKSRERKSPATRTFQALRIAVNNELENIKKGLLSAVEILDVGGRIVVISFHSLEDRICKNFFKEMAKQNILEIVVKKPVVPGTAEIQKNPRSRSAKLRVVKIIKLKT